MTGACRLNNKSMRNIRREAVYQCLAIDLAMLGVLSREECEMLIGCGIPNGLMLPDGSAGKIISEKELPAKPDFIQTESEQLTPEPIPDATEGDEEPVDGDGGEGSEEEETNNEG